MISVERLDAALFGVYLVSVGPPRQGPRRPGPLDGVTALGAAFRPVMGSDIIPSIPARRSLRVIGQVDRGDPTLAELTLDGVTAFEGRLQTSDGVRHAGQDQTSASVYEASPRVMPSKPRSPEYAAHFEVRKVSSNGGIRWHSAWVNVSHLLGGKFIGLEEIAPGVWAVFFGPVSLGWLHIDKGAILDHDGSSSRNPRR